MATVNIQISNVKRKKDNITFTATTNNKVIKRTLNINDIDNWTDFSDWLINQQPDFELLPEKEKQLEITFHTEIVIDPENGEETTIKVVDDVGVT